MHFVVMNLKARFSDIGWILMSATIMIRKCQHCGHKYSYNPSVGKFGIICPKCGKPQTSIVPTPSIKDIFKI